MRLKSGDTVAFLGCSDPLTAKQWEQTLRCRKLLEDWGLAVRIAPSLAQGWWQGEKRAADLMELYEDGRVKMIFDLSGGDLANTVLPYLDWKVISQHPKPYWGYSDVTAVLNALYARSGLRSCLYQLRNLVSGSRENQEEQQRRFYGALFQGEEDLYRFSAAFLRGRSLEGTVAGGNLRCLLKLAGTPYFPDFRDKILFLESMGGESWRTASLLGQLKLMGVLEQMRGVLLGTFTKLEESGSRPGLEELILSVMPEDLPVAVTRQIGHGADSRCLRIGGELKIGAGTGEIRKT